MSGDDLLESRLEDRDLAGLEPLDLGRIDVDADHVVADFGEAGAGDQADVAGAEYRDAHMQAVLQESALLSRELRIVVVEAEQGHVERRFMLAVIPAKADILRRSWHPS